MTDMEETFDYGKAMAELETIVRKAEDPATSLDEMDALLKRSGELIGKCREYLTCAREKLEPEENS